MSLERTLSDGTVRVLSVDEDGRNVVSVAIATLERGRAAGISEWTLDLRAGPAGNDRAWEEISALLDGSAVAGEALQAQLRRLQPFAARPERLPATGHELCRLCLALHGQEGAVIAEVLPSDLAVRIGLRPALQSCRDGGTRGRAVLMAELLVAVAAEARPGGLDRLDQQLWRDRGRKAATEPRP